VKVNGPERGECEELVGDQFPIGNRHDKIRPVCAESFQHHGVFEPSGLKQWQLTGAGELGNWGSFHDLPATFGAIGL